MKQNDKILEVNFKNLGEKEKRNCNEFLARQDNDIVFEEEQGTGNFVTHIKFVKSPKKFSKPPRSKSPGRLREGEHSFDKNNISENRTLGLHQ